MWTYAAIVVVALVIAEKVQHAVLTAQEERTPKQEK